MVENNIHLGKILAAMLRSLAEEVETLSDSELRKFTTSRRGRVSSTAPAKPDTEWAAIIEELRKAPATDAAREYLLQRQLSKTRLTKIAKVLDLPVSKHHTAIQIAEKIAEATVGFRTRSAAIRGEDVGRPSVKDSPDPSIDKS